MHDDDLRLDHAGIGVADIASASRFYDAALGALGLRPLPRFSRDFQPFKDGDELAAVGYGVSVPIFWIDLFHPAGTKNHTAFRALDSAQVDAFHVVGRAAGGTDNGAPGLREGYPPGYCAAFLLDPEGNNIEAVFRGSLEPAP
jgi:catechol 2,3-dioxygenase-like lactoylglutathione lyase family enzyme